MECKGKEMNYILKFCLVQNSGMVTSTWYCLETNKLEAYLSFKGIIMPVKLATGTKVYFDHTRF